MIPETGKISILTIISWGLNESGSWDFVRKSPLIFFSTLIPVDADKAAETVDWKTKMLI